MDVKSLENVDCVQMFCQIVSFKTCFAFPYWWGINEMFEIGIVKTLLGAKRNLAFNLLKKKFTVVNTALDKAVTSATVEWIEEKYA